MSGQDLRPASLGPVAVTADQARKAAVHVADRIAADNTGRLDDPDVHRELADLLDALGLHPHRPAAVR
jgi:hypothetical protein